MMSKTTKEPTSILTKMPHMEGEAVCLQCKHTWQAVTPIGVSEFECPKCETHKGVYKYLASPPDGVPILECNCGNHHFMARQDDKLQCTYCGTIQMFTYY